MLKSFTRTASLLALLLVATTRPTYAEGNVCATTKWKSFDNVVSYGDSTATALSKLKKHYAGKADAQLDKDTGNIIVSFKQNKRDVFDMIAYLIIEDTVYKVVYSYSNQFQTKLGGLADSAIAVSKKVIERVGEKADNAGKSGKDAFLATWNKNGGVLLEVYAKDPNVLVVRFTCQDLEATLQQKKAANTNFGF